MIRVLKFLAILLLPVGGISQESFRVAGKVIDALTQQPLQGASVFCQNTTTGTVTNADGEFRLTVSNGGYDLVVSFMGLETQSLRISNTMPEVSNLTIALRQKEKSMEEVAIVATNEVANGWEKYGQFLAENFIGKTANSNECSIVNPEALRFFYSRKRKRLKVTADTTVVIQNKALGYVIHYQLDSFVHEYDNGKTLYAGYPFYEQMEGGEEEMKTWKEKRLQAYNGSLLQFLRAYHDSTLNGDGFKIELIDDGETKPSPIYNPYVAPYYDTLETNKVELYFPGRLRVVYSKEKPAATYLAAHQLPSGTPVQISILDLANGIIVEENGYYYIQKDVLTLGYWAWEKMADFLPYDYYPNMDTVESMKAALTPEPVTTPEPQTEIPSEVNATERNY
ncbi:MAG: carboxypeptidase-like regulatory domain-containing protein [Chitinophagaceae bacterium]|nr:carboxypeptidase-like regulatory domain-containing protein [Chitinophagaceae bacterium]